LLVQGREREYVPELRNVRQDCAAGIRARVRIYRTVLLYNIRFQSIGFKDGEMKGETCRWLQERERKAGGAGMDGWKEGYLLGWG